MENSTHILGVLVPYGALVVVMTVAYALAIVLVDVFKPSRRRKNVSLHPDYVPSENQPDQPRVLIEYVRHQSGEPYAVVAATRGRGTGDIYFGWSLVNQSGVDHYSRMHGWRQDRFQRALGRTIAEGRALSYKFPAIDLEYDFIPQHPRLVAAGLEPHLRHIVDRADRYFNHQGGQTIDQAEHLDTVTQP